MKKPISFLTLLLSLLLLACQKPGPAEAKISATELEYRHIIAAGAVSDDQFSPILQELSPFLNEESYGNASDKNKQDQLMFRTSLLMAAALIQMNEFSSDRTRSDALRNDSRKLYMNAYLIDSAHALVEFKKLLPEQTDMTLYEAVKIPSYQIQSKKLEEENLVVDVHIPEKQEYYLMQMICGDILQKSKQENSKLNGLTVYIRNDEKNLIATGKWERQKDEIMLTIL